MENLRAFEYKFKPKDIPVFTRECLANIIRAIKGQKPEITLSLSLGRDFEKIEIKKGKAIIRDTSIPLEYLKEILRKTKDTDIVGLEEGGLFKIAFFRDRKFYKLRSVGPNIAPTLEINGIHMHRISSITPWEDSRTKVKMLKIRRGFRVLDICTGLGYTAINEVKMGAREVLSIEADPNVLEIAAYNPWSRELSDERIKILLGDAVQIVQDLPSEYFDRIMHDPPRFSLSPALYSREFYKELYRVLKRRGIMVHYTGAPGSRIRGIDLARSVIRKLKEVGFSARRVEEIQGVIAMK